MRSINRKLMPEIIRIAFLSIVTLTFFTSARAQATSRVSVADPVDSVVSSATLEARSDKCLTNDKSNFGILAGTYPIKTAAAGGQPPQKDNKETQGEKTNKSQQSRGLTEALFEGKITDERNRPVAGAVVEVRDRGCLCSSCPEDKKPCKCCIDQRATTGRDGTYSIRVERDKSYDLKIRAEDRAAGSFNGMKADKGDRHTRLDMQIERSSERFNRDREKPSRDNSPERERPDRERPDKEIREKERPERARP